MPATIRRVSRPPQDLTVAQEKAIERAGEKRAKAEADYRAAVVQAHREGASFAKLAEFTGHSTQTLQKWNREAQ